MTHLSKQHSRIDRRPSVVFLGYVMITLWFLLTIAVPTDANAQTPAPQPSLTASDIVPALEIALAKKGCLLYTSDAADE